MVRSIHVAFLGQTGGNVGGAEESLSLLLANLPREISPHVFLLSDGAFAERLRSFSLPVTVVDVPASFSGSTREKPQAGGMLALPAIAWRLSRRFRELGIDVVHAHTVKAHFVGGLAARMAGVPFVSHHRDLLEGGARTAMRLLSLTCTTERIALSHSVAQCYGVYPTDVIYEPIDVASYRNLPSPLDAKREFGFREDLPLVAIIGRINRWKGHDKFLRIAARVREEVPAQFAIIGSPVFRDADFLDELQAMVDTLGLRPYTTFVPWISDVKTAYAAMDVHCNCSTREPLGRTIIEAAACGVPSVCFDDGGAPEAIPSKESGVAVAPGDEAAFARAVIAFLKDPALRARAADEGLRSVPRYDVSEHVRLVSAVLRRAAA